MSETAAPSPAPAPSTPSPAPSGGGGPKTNSLSPRQFRDINNNIAQVPHSNLAQATVPQHAEQPEAPEQPEGAEQPEAAAEPTYAQPAEDYSWVSQYAQMHGMALPEILESLSQGYIPEALHGILKAKLKHGEDEWDLSLSDLRKRGMMHEDYTRKTQAFNRQREAWDKDKSEFLDMVGRWKQDPRYMLDSLESLEFPILDAAKLLAQRELHLQKMTPGERQLFEKNQKLQRELQRQQHAQEQFQRAQSEQATSTEAKKLHKFVQSTAQQLYQQAGIPINQNNWQLFLRYFETVANSFPEDTPWDENMIETAFDAMANDYRKVWAHREQAQAQADKRPAPQQFSQPGEFLQSSGTVKKIQGTRGPNRGGSMTTSQFRQMLKSTVR